MVCMDHSFASRKERPWRAELNHGGGRYKRYWRGIAFGSCSCLVLRYKQEWSLRNWEDQFLLAYLLIYFSIFLKHIFLGYCPLPSEAWSIFMSRIDTESHKTNSSLLFRDRKLFCLKKSKNQDSFFTGRASDFQIHSDFFPISGGETIIVVHSD